MQKLNKAKPYVTKDLELKILRALENYEILKVYYTISNISNNITKIYLMTTRKISIYSQKVLIIQAVKNMGFWRRNILSLHI